MVKELVEGVSGHLGNGTHEEGTDDAEMLRRCLRIQIATYYFFVLHNKDYQNDLFYKQYMDSAFALIAKQMQDLGFHGTHLNKEDVDAIHQGVMELQEKMPTNFMECFIMVHNYFEQNRHKVYTNNTPLKGTGTRDDHQMSKKLGELLENLGRTIKTPCSRVADAVHGKVTQRNLEIMLP